MSSASSVASRLREHWLLLLVSVACLTLAAAFAQVGSEVLEGDNKALDLAVRDWVRQHHTAAGQRIFSALTHLGDRILIIPLAIAVGWPLFRGHWWWLVLMLFCALASAELVSVLKQGFSVLRPPIGIRHSQSFAFPSGHVTATATIATVLGYLSLRRRIAPVAYITGGAVAVLIVAASRLYLDMHWASDVLGGMLIGFTFSAGCCALFEWLSLGFTTLHRRRSAGLRQVPG